MKPNVHAGRLERRVRPVARRETVLAFCPGAAWEAKAKTRLTPRQSPATGIAAAGGAA